MFLFYELTKLIISANYINLLQNLLNAYLIS